MPRKWCKHYQSPMDHTECEVGIKYEDVKVKHDPIPYTSRGIKYTATQSLPCFPSGDSLNLTGQTCAKCVFPTAEELAAEAVADRKSMEETVKARQAIVAHLGGPWKKGMPGRAGSIDCPVCEKPDHLAFSRAGYNGHIHAACKTDGCVSWME